LYVTQFLLGKFIFHKIIVKPVTCATVVFKAADVIRTFFNLQHK
jgi:hypothetical protein